MSRSPRLPPGSVICWKDAWDSAYHLLITKVSCSEKIQSNISKGKWWMGRRLQEPRHKLLSSRPVESQTVHFIHSLWNGALPGKLRLSAQGFYWGLAVEAPSAYYVSKFQTPRRKGRAQHEPHCFHSLGTVSHAYPLKNNKNTPETQVPRCQLRVSLASRPFWKQQLWVCYDNYLLQSVHG